MQAKALASLLKALSTTRRIQIIRILLDAGEPVAMTTVAALLKLDEGQTSYNLSKLADVGLVLRQQSGRWVFFTINQVTMNEIRKFWTETITTKETKDGSGSKD
jgi:DNA-binding transcriptional ArsR family regulator